MVVGKIGDDLRMDYTAVGDTTNLAARLQQLAQPGTVVISEATHKLVAGYFETRDLGEHTVKGHPEPVRVYEVLRARGRRTRLEVAAERGLTPRVGRDRELTTLLDLFQQAKAGHGQVVSITGEACIGKSRLVLECRRALAAAGETVTWLEGQCLSFGQAIPFLPVIDQLRANFGIEEADGEPEIIAKVEDSMRRMGAIEAHIPAIRYLLAVDPGDAALSAMEPAARRKQLVDAVLALSLRGAQLRPLVLVYEDLHWIDTSTEALLGTLLDAIAGVPLLLLLTYRVGYTPPFGSRSFHTTLTLQSLSAADTVAMASRILGTEHFPEALKAVLLAKAEGVPLFVEEVVKTLLDVGALRRENGSYRVVQGLVGGARARHRPGHHYGTTGPAGGGGQTHGATGVGDWPAVSGAPPGTHCGPDRTARGAADGVADARAHLPAGAASRTRLCVQARHDPGRGVQQPPAAAAAGVAPGGRRGH